MNRILERLDRVQRRHRWLALPIAVFKRFGEHDGGGLATKLSYWSLFSIFPLLLAFVTVLNLVLEDDPDTRQDLVDGALGQVPVIGTQLAETQTPLGGSWITIAVGVIVAVWSGLAAANSLQTAFQQIWDIPPFERGNVAVQRLRSAAFLIVLAVGISLSTLALSSPYFLDLGPLQGVVTIVVSLLANAVILLAAFRLFTPGRGSFTDLLPGVLGAGIAIAVLQALGALIVGRYIAGASDTYGTFAVVIALLSWFFLVSRVILLGAELNAVRFHHLVPRSLVGSSPLTEGDRRAAACDARRVHRDRRLDADTRADVDTGVDVERTETPA